MSDRKNWPVVFKGLVMGGALLFVARFADSNGDHVWAWFFYLLSGLLFVLGTLLGVLTLITEDMIARLRSKP